MTVIDCVVAAQPQLILFALFMSLVLTANYQAKKGLHFRSLERIQTFGDLTCIVFEKTGTLTYDRPTVSTIYVDGITYDAQINWETYQHYLNSIADK